MFTKLLYKTEMRLSPVNDLKVQEANARDADPLSLEVLCSTIHCIVFVSNDKLITDREQRYV